MTYEEWLEAGNLVPYAEVYPAELRAEFEDLIGVDPKIVFRAIKRGKWPINSRIDSRLGA